MRISVRCHAVITPSGVEKNAVISFDGKAMPSHGIPSTQTAAGIMVSPFIAEVHSTVDYNGIAVVGDADLTDVRLTLGSLHDEVERIAVMSHDNPGNRVSFIPLSSR